MELRDYVRMLRRGWPTVALLTAIFLAGAVGYLLVSPKQYQATASIFVSGNDPQTITDLAQGVQFSGSIAATYAAIADSAAVLGPVADESRPHVSLEDLQEMTFATVRNETTLIDITVVGPDRAQTADLANGVAQTAVEVIPGLDTGSGDEPSVRLRLVQRAAEPTAAISPDTKRVLSMGGVVGLCLGLALTIATQALDTRLRRSGDVQQLTDVPLLAVLPHATRAQRHGIVVRDEPVGRAGEAYRSLRTNLSHLAFEERRSLMFTSVADDRDGAEVPVNLAWSIAQGGRRVLLIDMDLRQSWVGSALGIRPGLGLADVLAGEVTPDAVVRTTQHDKLSVVLSGTSQPSPSDLLTAPIMAELLRGFEAQFDYVILHAPPLLTYTDAAAVSHATGGTLVTIAAGRTRAQDLTTALTTLSNVRVRPFGLVLSGAREPVLNPRRSWLPTLRPRRPLLG